MMDLAADDLTDSLLGCMVNAEACIWTGWLEGRPQQGARKGEKGAGMRDRHS